MDEKEADRQNLSSENMEGDLLFDEVSIQDDLVLEKDKGVFHLKGFVDTGIES